MHDTTYMQITCVHNICTYPGMSDLNVWGERLQVHVTNEHLAQTLSELKGAQFPSLFIYTYLV